MPSPLATRLLRVPNRLYDAGLGRLLGHRFIQLTHVGRRSGRHHRTVLEVVRHDPGTGEVIVVSGFGPGSDWYRNVLAGGAVEVRTAGERWRPAVRVLAEDEAAAVLADYEYRNRLAAPVIRWIISRLTGARYDGTDQARRLAVRALPMVSLSPERE